MREHYVREEEAFSNVNVARACGVDEKTVRQWRLGEKQLRAETIALFPSRLRDEVLALIRNLESRSPDPALVQLSRALDAVESELSKDASGDAVPALDHAIGRIVVLKKKAMGER